MSVFWMSRANLIQESKRQGVCGKKSRSGKVFWTKQHYKMSWMNIKRLVKNIQFALKMILLTYYMIPRYKGFRKSRT